MMMHVAEPETDAYLIAVQQALEHFHDTDWLAQYSPLIAPYFLGTIFRQPARLLPKQAYGQALQKLIASATAELPASQAELMSLTYLDSPDLEVDVIADRLLISRRTYYRRRDDAIQSLAGALLKLAQPTLRSELPPTMQLIGRQTALAESLITLRAGGTVALTGISGIGKTTLGSALAHAWGSESAFWFTLRAGVNDNANALVFSLAHFLGLLGAKSTWSQVVVSNGTAALDQTLAALRFDLDELKTRKIVPLICLDELGVLDPATAAHAQLLQFIEALRPYVPLLVMSSTLVLDADEHHALSGLSRDETGALLRMVKPTTLAALDVAALDELHAETRGHPLSVRLVGALLQSGEPVDVLWRGHASIAAAMELLLNRLWKRLSLEARAELKRVCVYRGAAPDGQDAMQALRDFGLLVEGAAHGEVSMVPTVQAFVRRTMQDEELKQAHLAAARVMQSRGDAFEAAYHFVQAGEAALAVWTWYAQRTFEVERGRGSAALALLMQIDAAALPDERDRAALHIARSELLKLAGRHADAALEASVATAVDNPVVRAHALRLEADGYSEAGQSAQALARYREAIETLTATPHSELVHVFENRSYVYSTGEVNLESAMRDAKVAQVYANVRRGNIEQMLGQLDQALLAYEAACTIADALPDAATAQSRAACALGSLYWQLNRLDEAEVYLLRSIKIERMRRHVSNLVTALAHLIGVHNMAGRFRDALPVIEEAEQVLQQSGNVYLGLSLHIREAATYIGLGESKQAEDLLQSVLVLEETNWRAEALILLGQVQVGKGEIDTASATLRRAIDAARESRLIYDEAAAWRALARVLIASRRTDEARAAAQTALGLYTAMGMQKEQAELRAMLAKLAEST